MIRPPAQDVREWHERLDRALDGDEGALDELTRHLDSLRPRDDLVRLTSLVEATFRGDEQARESLDRWLRRVRDLLVAGREAREEVKSLAYVVTIRVASKSLRGRFADVQNDPASVAAQVWTKKIRSFLAGLESGRYTGVLQFIAWVKTASRYVILGLIREQRAAAERKERSEDDLIRLRGDAGPAPGQPDDAVDRLEDQRALLRTVFEALGGHDDLLILVVLNKLCDLSSEEIGEIMAIEPRVVRNRLAKAIRMIGDRTGG